MEVRQSVCDNTRAARPFAPLSRRSARKVRSESVSLLIEEILGAAPDPALLDKAKGAAGNALFVTELTRGAGVGAFDNY